MMSRESIIKLIRSLRRLLRELEKSLRGEVEESMGVFTYKPKSLSNITCGQCENTTADYQVLPTTIEMNEAERLKIVYAEGEMGGSVNDTKRGLVPIQHRMLIKGTSQADAMANLRTLTQAITHPDGGYLEYKPIGLGDSIISTYYHYLQSAPPKLVAKGALIDTIMQRYTQDSDATNTHYVLVDIELMTKAWATSDPDTYETILTTTTIENCSDDDETDYVTVQSSSLKGDVFFPIIRVVYDSGDSRDQIGGLLVHKREIDIGDTDDYDYLEAEDGSLSNFSVQNDVGDVSSDQYVDCNLGGGWIEWSLDGSLDRKYIGKISPVAVVRDADASATYKWWWVLWTQGQGGALPYTNYYYTVSREVTGAGGGWQVLSGFGEMDLPQYPIPEYVSDADVGAYINNIRATLVCDTDDTPAGTAEVDFVVLPKVDGTAWIGRFSQRDISALRDNDADYLEIDTITNDCFLIDAGDDSILATWELEGMPLNELILRKGTDSKIRFLASYYASGLGFESVMEMDITVRGMHGTVYPFEVA